MDVRQRASNCPCVRLAEFGLKPPTIDGRESSGIVEEVTADWILLVVIKLLPTIGATVKINAIALRWKRTD